MLAHVTWTVVLAAVTGPADEVKPVPQWPTWSGPLADSRNSGRCRRAAATQPGHAGWSVKLAGRTRAVPAVDAVGNIYVVSDAGLESLDAKGSRRWMRMAPNTFLADRAPALDVGERLFVLEKAALCCFRASDGKRLWRTALPGTASGPPNVSPSGFVYLGLTRAEDGKGGLAAVRPNGKLMWKETTRTSDVATVHTVPSVTAGHTVYITTNYPSRGVQPPRSMIWGIDFNGNHVRRYRREHESFTPVTLTPDDVVLFASYGSGSTKGQLYCLTLSGQTRWTRPIGAGTRSGVAYGLDGLVRVFDDASGTLYAYDMWGELKWTHKAGKAVQFSPIVSQDNVTLVCCDGKVTALDGAGKPLWGPTPFPSETPPVMTVDGRLLGVTQEGTRLTLGP